MNEYYEEHFLSRYSMTNIKEYLKSNSDMNDETLDKIARMIFSELRNAYRQGLETSVSLIRDFESKINL